MRLGFLLAGIAGALACAALAAAAETRTYQFVPDGSLPYTASCGECGSPLAGARADVAGYFTVTLDTLAGTGALVALDDQLVNYFNANYAPGGGLALTPLDPASYAHIGPPWASYNPLVPGTLSTEGGALRLTATSGDPGGSGGFLIAAPYSILMTGNEALFSATVPISDYYITVTDARAVLVPEPALAAVLLLAGAGLSRRRLTRRRH